MPRQHAEPAGERPAGRDDQAGPVEVVSLTFGTYPEITALNERFVPDQRRLKLTLDVHLDGLRRGVDPPALMGTLETICPTLSRHVCCGHDRIQDSFLVAGRRPCCAMQETDEAVDIAHLIEHVIIDFQHYISDMRICSGVTCGHRTPTNRFDLFIESPDERVSRLGVSLACDVMSALLNGADPDPLYGKIVRLARHVYRHRGASVTPATARSALGNDGQHLSALLSLAELGFVCEIATSMNFSGLPLFALAAIDQAESPFSGS